MSEISKNKSSLQSGLQQLKHPKGLALCGFLIALYLAVYSLNIPISQVVQIRFGFLVLAVAGLCGGPFTGLLVGLLGDVLSMILLPASGGGGSFFFGFTVSYSVIGFFCGLIFYKQKITFLRIMAAGIIEFLVSVFLNSLWLSMLMGTTYGIQIITRLPKCIMMLIVNTIILFIFLKSLSIALKKSMIFAE